MYMLIELTIYKVKNVAYITLEQQQICSRNIDSPARELGETEKPEVKYTPQHK